MSKSPSSPAKPLSVAFQDVHKRFGAVHANRGVSLRIEAGSVHGIIGENGAGKSTLMSMLYGVLRPDSGTIMIDDVPVTLNGTQDAIRLGIGMVHQHFMLVECFSVIENVLLGAEGGMLAGPAIARARTHIRRLCEEFGIAVDPDARVSELPVGMQQWVEILKALYKGARILILDEPTAVLTPAEVSRLMDMVKRLRERGTTVIIITHKLKEVMAMTDHVTVMRAGQVVAERVTSQASINELAVLMVGRQMKTEPGPRMTKDQGGKTGQVLLRAEHLEWKDSQGVQRLKQVSLELRAGEILGVAGVSGNGQSELLLTLAGMSPLSGGAFHVVGRDGASHTIDAARTTNPRRMRHLGVAHVPEDRHRLAIVLEYQAWESAALGYLDDPALRKGPFIHPARMRSHCKALMKHFEVRPVDENLASSHFSGGNQQKLVLAREFHRQPHVLLIGQPTRGVDIGAIELIYARLRELRDRGCAVLVVSTELDEILALSDRIAVMSGGRITGVLDRGDATPSELGALMGDGAREPGTERIAA